MDIKNLEQEIKDNLENIKEKRNLKKSMES